MANVIRQIELIKASLSKKLTSAGGVNSLTEDADVESINDMLQELDVLDVNLEILTKTLIGTIVSKYKKHEMVGSTAKALVKKWKLIAKQTHQQQQKKHPPVAAAAAAVARTSKSASTSSESKSKKLERRSSTNTATAEMREEWSSLQPYRATTCQKLHDILIQSKSRLVKEEGYNPGAIMHLVVERATDIEQSIQNKFLSNKPDYLTKARSLCFNIKKNESLAHQIVLGQLPAKALVDLSSEELVNDKRRKEIEEQKKKAMDANLLDWDAQNEDKINKMCGITGDALKASLFTCHRCKSIKTTHTQKQTRSADEPMTVFVLCLNCNYRWKFS